MNILDGVVKAVYIPVTTTGTAGSATGTATSDPIIGQIMEVEVLWHGSAPATSDIVVEGAITGLDLYAKVNVQTAVRKTPSQYSVSSANAALTGDVTPQKICIAEAVKVTVSQANALTNAAVVRVMYRSIVAKQVAVNTTGSAGVAAGVGTTDPFTGMVLGIMLDYNASAPATTDLTVTGAATGFSYFANTNVNTDGYVVPALFSVDLAGTALTSDVTPRNYCVGEGLTFTLAQCNALTPALTATVFYFPVAGETVTVNTTGSAGSALGSASTFAEQGEILGMLINYNATAPGTTDITISSQDGDANHIAPSIYAKANSVTDVYIVPGRFAVSNADAALTSDVTPDRMFFGTPLSVSVAQSNALTNAVSVTIFTWLGS